MQLQPWQLNNHNTPPAGDSLLEKAAADTQHQPKVMNWEL
jgi:hypothetical protein